MQIKHFRVVWIEPSNGHCWVFAMICKPCTQKKGRNQISWWFLHRLGCCGIQLLLMLQKGYVGKVSNFVTLHPPCIYVSIQNMVVSTCSSKYSGPGEIEAVLKPCRYEVPGSFEILNEGCFQKCWWYGLPRCIQHHHLLPAISLMNITKFSVIHAHVGIMCVT